MLAIAAQTAEPNWLKSLKKKKHFFKRVLQLVSNKGIVAEYYGHRWNLKNLSRGLNPPKPGLN